MTPRLIDADLLKKQMESVCMGIMAGTDSYNAPLKTIDDAPTSEAEPKRKTGKWTEKEVIHAEEAKEIITEWQSCKCSVCGRYDTRPYLYYFDEPRFCSWCGAEMKGREDETD